MATSSIQQITIQLGCIDGREISMTFYRIPACPDGFLMGGRGQDADEEPIHRVVIPEDFWLAETPVTQEQFAVWTEAEGVDHQNHFNGHPEHPAESMTWTLACQFCDWLQQNYSNQLPADCRVATLPTEAYWEYACRAGTNTEYYTGDGEIALLEAGWFGESSESGSTHPVGQLRPNDFCLYDMHGNVWEWCLDRWDATSYRRRWDGISTSETYELNEKFGDRDDNPYRVMRGGSWFYTAFWCRSAFRDWFRAGNSDRCFGFRVCLVRSPPASQTLPAKPER